jgi:RNA recognition motif-containing protein
MTYGEVIEISIREVANLRGQAFVTFRDQEMADRALKELQGFVLFGNKMVINPELISIYCRTYNTRDKLVISH